MNVYFESRLTTEDGHVWIVRSPYRKTLLNWIGIWAADENLSLSFYDAVRMAKQVKEVRCERVRH